MPRLASYRSVVCGSLASSQTAMVGSSRYSWPVSALRRPTKTSTDRRYAARTPGSV